MKKHLVFCALICLAAWVWAGNRADINADQVVNSADLAVLANIVSGNLDIAGYNLTNVVVVAPQGGDFTSPIDAANWVTTQSPSTSNRFLIWVTPGEYTVSGNFFMPSFTTLKGADRRNCRLTETGGVVISCSSRESLVIADLQISGRAGVDLQTCSDVVLRNLQIDCSFNSTTFDSRCVNAVNSTGVVVEDCILNSTAGSSSTNSAYLVFNSNSYVTLRDCTGAVSHARASTRAIALDVYDPGGITYPEFWVENCRLEATAATAGYAFYLRKDSPGIGWTRLFNCILVGATNTVSQLVYWNCCDPYGVPIP